MTSNPERGRTDARQGAGRTRQRTAKTLADLTERRRKLLELYYQDRITPELFTEEEARISKQIEVARSEHSASEGDAATHDKLGRRFEEVLATLEHLDIERVWEAATEQERRVLIEELLEGVTVYPDHREVAVHGAPTINVLLNEVGLVDQSETAGVGGPKRRTIVEVTTGELAKMRITASRARVRSRKSPLKRTADRSAARWELSPTGCAISPTGRRRGLAALRCCLQ